MLNCCYAKLNIIMVRVVGFKLIWCCYQMILSFIINGEQHQIYRLKKTSKIEKDGIFNFEPFSRENHDTRFVHLLRIRKGFGGTLFHSRSP